MYQVSHHDLDRRLTRTLDGMGVVGERFRESLSHDLKSKVILSEGPGTIEIIGHPGSGRHTVAAVVHAAARTCLERRGRRRDFDCGTVDSASLEGQLQGALHGLDGGTLVLNRVDELDAAGQRELRRVLDASASDTLICALRHETGGAPVTSGDTTRIEIKPLHERDEDIWQLIEHFYTSAVQSCPLEGCRGFSRQAMADIATSVEDTGMGSVRRLRRIVRDLVFEASLETKVPLKLTSDLVRPYLESNLGQTTQERESRQAEIVASQFDALVESSTVDRVARLHALPAELINRQAEVIREVIGYIDDVPRSYRNIMDRSEDVMRSALLVLSGATTQAEFRRFFGDERFMRPTKSVAWAFYNRVFKRDV